MRACTELKPEPEECLGSGLTGCAVDTRLSLPLSPRPSLQEPGDEASVAATEPSGEHIFMRDGNQR